MPGLLFSLSLACLVAGAMDEPKHIDELSAFNTGSATERGSQLPAPRPPINLDAEVLLYAGMPIEIDGETKYIGNLSFYTTLNSLAVSDDGRLAAVIAYFDKPTFPFGVPQGYAVVREQPDGTFAVLATADSPLVGYPKGRIAEFSYTNGQSKSRAAVLPDGSYRLFARLLFDAPDTQLGGEWIVDIDDEGVHPLLRIQGHELLDGRELSISFDIHPQTDLSLPVGGIGTVSGTPGRVGWRLNGREVVLLTNLLDDPLANSANVLASGRFVVPLIDGSILTPFGLSSESLKSFFARIGAKEVREEFECSRGQSPSLPDGSERLVFSNQRGHAIESGYFVSLRGLVDGEFYEILVANFGNGVERFLDNRTFDAFPPFDADRFVQKIVATNNRSEVVAWRGTGPEQQYSSHALYFGGPDKEWTPINASGQAEQLGVYSAQQDQGVAFDLNSPLHRDLTHNGTFVFSVDDRGSINPAHIAWSLQHGYRLFHTRGDLLALPGDTVKPIQPYWLHVSQNELNTIIFAAAQYSDDPEIEWKDAIFRQSIESTLPLADLNRDGEVNLLDLNIVVRGMSGGGTYEFSGDIDFDGSVDENDLQMLLDQWGQH